MIYEKDSILGYKYIPHAKDYNSKPAFYSDNVNINSFGYNDPEFSPKKEKGVFRIIIVGSSDECGFETDAPQTYVSLLRAKMKQVSDKVEIINCSIDGVYSKACLIKHIKKEIIGYQPDVILLTTRLKLYEAFLYRTLYKDFIIVYPDLNDFEDAKKYIDNLHYQFSCSKWLYDYSYSFRAICRYYINNNDEFTDLLSQWDIFQDKKRIRDYTINLIHYGKIKWEYFTYEESLEMFKELSDSLKSVNSKLVIYNRFINNHIERDFLKSAGIGYLGMESRYNNLCTYGKEDSHSTQIGHEKSAIAFYDALLKSDIIPDEFINIDKPILKEDSIKGQLNAINLEELKVDSFKDERVLTKANNTRIVTIDFSPINYSVSYSELINKYYKLRAHDVTVDRKEMSSIKSVNDLIIRINELIVNEQPRLIIIPIPVGLLIDYPTEAIDYLKKFENYCRIKGTDLLFIHFREHPSLSILESMFKNGYMNCESTNINSNNSIFKSFTESKQDSIISTAKADFLYKKTKEILINNGELLKEDLNLARGKLVNVSSSTETNKFSSDFITNDKEIKINGTKGWVSDTLNAHFNHKEWITVDLNDTIEVNRVVLYPIYSLDMNMEAYGFPLGFKIQVSNDGIVWETVKELENYSIPKIYEPQVFDFNKRYARYVKILGTNLQRNKYDEGSLYRMALSGIEIYNTQKINE
ncbi:discoidin domain-containing protein [Snuella sedimenti]|uniref:Discoidin domain-containing protein n=1 Tax=Snuella sedimenti TaxID=2798802 RepID=A0A8J7J3M3_9FLAO|nr:discoidin domain-containing protein [Snuella sedimenti]MBJ6367823.1 discoidin domain-containing protein [Snuella sedimenti]